MTVVEVTACWFRRCWSSCSCTTGGSEDEARQFIKDSNPTWSLNPAWANHRCNQRGRPCKSQSDCPLLKAKAINELRTSAPIRYPLFCLAHNTRCRNNLRESIVDTTSAVPSSTSSSVHVVSFIPSFLLSEPSSSSSSTSMPACPPRQVLPQSDVAADGDAKKEREHSATFPDLTADVARQQSPGSNLAGIFF